MEGLCNRFLYGEPENLWETTTQSVRWAFRFAPRKMPRFRHVQNDKVLKRRHEKQGMFPETISWIGSFFRVSQLMSCSCSSATGQQQGERLSLVHTLREQLLEMRRGEVSFQQSERVAGQGREALRHPDCHLKIYMKQIDHFLAWEGQTYIKTCSCAHAFLCFSHRKVSGRGWTEANTCPIYCSFLGFILGEQRREKSISLYWSA